MKFDKRTVMVAVAAFALAWFISHSRDGIPNPFVPQRPDRPVLKFIMRAAKTFLWVAMFAESNPQPPANHVVQSHVGPDGHAMVNHAEGF